MLIIRHTDIMFGQRERMWAVLVSPEKRAQFPNAPRAAMHGCEVGRALWLIRWLRMSLSRGRWSRRTQTERPTPAVFSKTLLTDGIGATVFLPPPTGDFSNATEFARLVLTGHRGTVIIKGWETFLTFARDGTHLFSAARTAETEQLFIYDSCQQIQSNIIDLSLFGELKVKLISETRSEHAEKSMIYSLWNTRFG